MIETERKLRHQKYKRCVAMSTLCFERIEQATNWREDLYYHKWWERWYVLAEKFKDKEAK